MRLHRRCTMDEMEPAKNKIKRIIRGGLFGFLGIGIAILFGFVIMWLWNRLMIDIFSLRAITYWEAVGLFILSKIFFGGFGGSHGNDDHPRRRVRSEFAKEFDKEFDKEFEKEFRKECDSCNSHMNGDNDEYDALYEKWWNEKGEKNFSDYMDAQSNDD